MVSERCLKCNNYFVVDTAILVCHNPLMKQSPAEFIIEKFGGVNEAARAFGRNPGSVSRWKKQRKDGAPTGSIPVAMHKKILAAAKKRNIEVTLSDIVLGPSI